MNDKFCFTVKNSAPEISPAADVPSAASVGHLMGNQGSPITGDPSSNETAMLLRILIQSQERLIRTQNRQNELLEEIAELISAPNRQRQNELAQWRRLNPRLAILCRKASEKLSDVQTEFLNALSEEIEKNKEIAENEFQLGDFLDHFGPRVLHLNAMLQILSQLADPVDKR